MNLLTINTTMEVVMFINIKGIRINMDAVISYTYSIEGDIVFVFDSIDPVIIACEGHAQALVWIEKIDNLLNVNRIDPIKE